MIRRAIISSKNHGINLKHGSPNPGKGDCSFEAVIQNINDRSCYTEKLPMTIDWYRRIWAKDMENRTINTSLNIYSRQEWRDGWEGMQNPGTYERGIFGDLMLPGIACGVRKYLLIFNTNINTPHDPIYIIDPSNFDVRPDTNIPVVLAYNMSHYESMEPCTDHDTQSTVALVKEYLEGRYRYNRYDLPHLISMQIETQQDNNYIQLRNEQRMERNERKEQQSYDKTIKVLGRKEIISQRRCMKLEQTKKRNSKEKMRGKIQILSKFTNEEWKISLITL